MASIIAGGRDRYVTASERPRKIAGVANENLHPRNWLDASV
jgi:hypothetical protein